MKRISRAILSVILYSCVLTGCMESTDPSGPVPDAGQSVKSTFPGTDRKNTKEEIPGDFNFRLNFNTYGRDQIDTFNGTFTKDLVMDGTSTIDFIIPNDIKKEIYKLMMEIDIFSFPDILKVDGMGVTPSCDYELSVSANGRKKTIVWKEGFYPSMNVKLPEENENFLKLVKEIGDYIYSTDEYKNMPQAKGCYD